ncbi:YjcZ family sporulation protein [Haladaptatus caseinilyticus]|uniref:YjcZ family sporulation protein n=1 Tax=Haladaptatus caseinilyticus TaxID=2993314 RepID=UPI0026E55B54|nr:YjcZ family sporulation protein [Haladaptatus caseinilyticus]
MSDENTSTTDENGIPFQATRRTLVQLLGSAIATGAIAGSVAGDGDVSEMKRTNAGYEDGRNGAFDWTGLSFTDDEFHLEWLQFTPTVDGETEEMLICEGFAATVESDAVTDMGVDYIDIHEDLEELILELVGHLAAGNASSEFDTAPNVMAEYLDHIDTRHFEHVRTAMENDGVAGTLEHRINNGASGDYSGGGFVLILVLFILLVIIGAGFGVGTGRPSDEDCR